MKDISLKNKGSRVIETNLGKYKVIRGWMGVHGRMRTFAKTGITRNSSNIEAETAHP
jgi:hypothetical protein